MFLNFSHSIIDFLEQKNPAKARETPKELINVERLFYKSIIEH